MNEILYCEKVRGLGNTIFYLVPIKLFEILPQFQEFNANINPKKTYNNKHYVYRYIDYTNLLGALRIFGADPNLNKHAKNLIQQFFVINKETPNIESPSTKPWILYDDNKIYYTWNRNQCQS